MAHNQKLFFQNEHRKFQQKVSSLYLLKTFGINCNLGTSIERQKELDEIVRVRNEERAVLNATTGKAGGVYK